MGIYRQLWLVCLGSGDSSSCIKGRGHIVTICPDAAMLIRGLARY